MISRESKLTFFLWFTTYFGNDQKSLAHACALSDSLVAPLSALIILLCPISQIRKLYLYSFIYNSKIACFETIKSIFLLFLLFLERKKSQTCVCVYICVFLYGWFSKSSWLLLQRLSSWLICGRQSEKEEEEARLAACFPNQASSSLIDLIDQLWFNRGNLLAHSLARSLEDLVSILSAGLSRAGFG